MGSNNEVRTAAALAHPNIALIKYWGKATDARLNEPAVASLSITLSELATHTRLIFDPTLTADQLFLNGREDTCKQPRISENLDKLRRLAGVTSRCRIETENNFPTGAGLASSASGFAALVAAADRALDLRLDVRRQTMLARAMSGSAARSIEGGFVKIELGGGGDNTLGSAYANQVADRQHWPLEVCVGIISEQEKTIGSTEGMERSRLTSPYYSAWIAGNDKDVEEAEHAVRARDFERLAELSEFSCLKMHALALASRPGLMYWRGATLEAMHRIRELRSQGTAVFFTVDAGPQIKAICGPGHGERVARALAEIPGMQRTIRCGLGDGVQTFA